MSLNRLFENTYVQELAIFDHLRECTIIEEAIKEEKNSYLHRESDRCRSLKFHLQKELADLYLILSEYLDPEVVEERRQRFIEKEEEE